MAPPSSQLAGNRTCSPLCPHTLQSGNPVSFIFKVCMESTHFSLPMATPWSCPPSPVFTRTSAAASPSLCSSTHHQLSFSQETRRSLRTPESGQIPPSLAQNLSLVPHVKVKERRKGCWGLPCPGPAWPSCVFFFFSGPAFETPETPGVSTKPTRSFFHILIMLVLMSLPAHLLLSPPF